MGGKMKMKAPSSKSQAPNKLKIPSSKTFGVWCLVIIWSLGFAAWNLAHGQSINITSTNLINVNVTNPTPVVVVMPPTNFVQVTIIQQTVTNPQPVQVEIFNGVIDPKISKLLFQEVIGPMTFTLAPFTTNSFTMVKYRNLTGALMFWPSNVWWLNGSSPPTNQLRGWIWFEETKGEVWASP